jgi:hypothetical protein
MACMGQNIYKKYYEITGIYVCSQLVGTYCVVNQLHRICMLVQRQIREFYILNGLTNARFESNKAIATTLDAPRRHKLL